MRPPGATRHAASSPSSPARSRGVGRGACAGLLAGLLLAAAPATAATRYVFTTFRGDAATDEKLSVYTSTDGLRFTLLANTGYGGPTGVLRDPSILKHTDGKYYVAYTLQSWTTSSMSFGIATSTDLRTWTFLVETPAGVSGARDTWAPEWFVDTDGVHLIINIDTLGTDSDFRSYDFKAKDDTLTKWEAPVPLGIGPNNIDTFVVKVGATYHAFSKNETTKYIEHATASSFHGPWTWVGKNDWAGWGSGKEGIALFQLDDGTWRMFLDCYGNCGFLYADSTDLNTWTATKTVPNGLSGTVRHGTVLREELDPGGSGGAGGAAGGTGGVGARGGSGGSGPGGASGGGGRGGASGGGGRGGASGGGGAASVGGASGGPGGSAGGAGGSGAGGSAPGGSGGGPGSGAAGSAGTAGAAPGGSGPGGRAGAPGTGGTAAPETDDGGGCACAVPAGTTPAPWLAALALLGLGLRRRRRG